MPGKTPYAKEKNADMAQSIANMRFPFSWSGQPGNRDVDRPSGRWRFVWSHLGSLKGDFYNTFMCGKEFNAPEKRKSARFWLHEVQALRKDLEHPYDMESLELFPKTFKRDAKIQFIVNILIRLIGFVIRALIRHLTNILSVLVRIIHRWIESLFIQRKWRFFIRLQLFRILIGIGNCIVASVNIYDHKYIKNCVVEVVAVRLILLLGRKRTLISVLV